MKDELILDVLRFFGMICVLALLLTVVVGGLLAKREERSCSAYINEPQQYLPPRCFEFYGLTTNNK